MTTTPPMPAIFYGHGSPLNALAVKPPFKEIHLIDLDHAKVENLRASSRASLIATGSGVS